MNGVLRLLSAFVLRDFRIATSYKFNFFFQLTYGFFIVAAFYFIAKMADNDTARQILARYDASPAGAFDEVGAQLRSRWQPLAR